MEREFMELIKVLPGKGKHLRNALLVYRNKDGKIKEYTVTGRRKIRHRSDLEGFVAGVIIVVTDPSGAVLTTKEFRLGVNHELFGFPSGMCDHHETVEKCAVREVYEETGIENVVIDEVSSPMYINPAMGNEKIVIIYGHIENVQSPGGSNHVNEEISSFWLPPADIPGFLNEHKEDISVVNRLILEQLSIRRRTS